MEHPSAAFDQPICSPQKIAAVVAELAQQGVAPSAALEGTGLDVGHLQATSTRVSYRQFDAVFRNAIRLSTDPAVAFRAGQRMHITAHGIYGYALLSSPTYADAVDFSARYFRVMGPLTDMSFTRGESAVFTVCEPLHWPDPTEPIYRFIVEFAFAMHLTVVRDMAGEAFRYSHIHLAYAAPEHADAYSSLFGCPVLFEQRSNELVYDVAWLGRPATFADPISNAMGRNMCERLLSELNASGGIAASIRQALLEQPGQFPSVEAMAERMSMHPRALRRRLEAEKTTYRDLLAGVRMRLAIEYLRNTRMTTDDIASRLGYSDAANFRHAFARWTGKSPSSYRGASVEFDTDGTRGGHETVHTRAERQPVASTGTTGE